MVKYDETYLVVKHLPAELSDAEKIDFLKYFGASQVKCLPSKLKKGGLCFARFGSKELAKEVLLKLHQAELLGQILSVEYVRGSDLHLHLPSFTHHDEAEDSGDGNRVYHQFLTRLNSWVRCVDLVRPPPSHLRYSYPPPSLDVLTNVVRELYSRPPFYTQVLHLMNRMNLPCPLNGLLPSEYNLVVLEGLGPNEGLSEGESEMEEEETQPMQGSQPHHLPKKRKRVIRRLVKPPTITAKTPVVPPSEIFETQELNLKRIEVKLPSDLASLRESKVEEGEVMQLAPLELPAKPLEESAPESEETYSGRVITEEELKSNRISERDQRLLPVFKNYQAGQPSCRLYIKNLARTVGQDDLHYVFRRYITPLPDDQPSLYDVRLMQEGRMKGQAFVTLERAEDAERALQETNGFVLRGKPMVVQFARSVKPKE